MTLARAEPRSFGPADRPCFGWLHRSPPDVAWRDVGLVICKPFGYEAICAHRSLRHFADSAAAMGVPSLRFDYDGTGDAAGDDRDPDRWSAWVGSVHHAIDELRTLTLVKSVCLLGVRLGAALAAKAASGRADVAGLIAIVPVLAGKPWLRELNALEIAMGFAGPPPGFELREGEQESVGFVITADTKKSLQDVDLVKMTSAPAADVLLLDRDDLPANVKWAERLVALGARVDHRRLPGYAQMMLDPHESEVPTMMVDAVSQWLGQRGNASVSGMPLPRVASSPSPIRVVSGVEETAGFLDETKTLFGIVSAPTATPRPTRAIVLLNAGAISHIGPSRLYVDLARRWAARGYLVLRFDQAGIGDSAPYPGEPENVVYSVSAAAGVAGAMAFLREKWCVTEYQALGLCSGAYHALKAAVAGLPLKAVAIVNPLVFFWKPGMSLAYPSYQVSGEAARYQRSIFQLDKWKKFFAGKVSVRAFAEVIARRIALHAEIFVRNMARGMGRPLPQDLGADLEAVSRRGVDLRFVFATGDPGEDLLHTQGGTSVSRLMREQRLHIRRIAGPNHAFTPAWTRAALTDVLEEELSVR